MAYTEDDYQEDQELETPEGVDELSDEELEEVAGGWTEPTGGSGTGSGTSGGG